MKLDFATDDEIKKAEKVLLPEGSEFCDERRKIINCNESADINACPGSGKTTTLLAKLVVLADRLPFSENQGICVLTHTNVAIDEIKNKLGAKSDVLFKYPNHFGTIQSFVNKFLAIPCFIKCFDAKPSFIDSSRYYDLVEKKYERNNWLPKKWLDRQGGGNKLASYRFNFEDINIISKSLLGDIIIQNTQGPAYKKIKKFKIQLLKNGCLNFDDTYSLANFYLRKLPRLGKLFSKRFSYLFIDEMQDTDEHQVAILNKLFDRETIVVQRFGDPHQSIFNKVQIKKVWEIQNELPITTSKRFGENIAKPLRTTCIQDNNSLKPTDDIESLPPYIIVFENPKEAIPKFCELITNLEIEQTSIWEYSRLEKNKKRPVKIVAWLGKDEEETDKYTLQSYYRAYKKDLRKTDNFDYNALKSFIRKTETKRTKKYQEAFAEALLQVLALARKKNETPSQKRSYTKTTMYKYLEDNKTEIFRQLRTKIAKWSKEIHNGTEIFNDSVLSELKSFIRNEFCPAFEIEDESEDLKSFIESQIVSGIEDEQATFDNHYIWPEDETVRIELGTIHSVKGESHTATLLLETSYYGEYESERIIKQLTGIPYTNTNLNQQKRIKETLKMAYVAMSRPTHFLCMAIQKDRIAGHEEELKENGWEIVKTYETK